MTKHIHAELMAQYAQDALETDMPWSRWETFNRTFNTWTPCVRSPEWNISSKYRRKPSPDVEIEYIHKFVYFDEDGRVITDNLIHATHIGIYTKDEYGNETWVYDVNIPRWLLCMFDVIKSARMFKGKVDE